MFVDSILSNIILSDDAVQLNKKENPNYLFCRSQDEKRNYHITRHLSDKHFQEIHCTPANTLILNCNYTQTAKQLYAIDKEEIINVHGALNNKYNPIIFGYGDELDDDYKRIEKLQGNDFLENIKSIRYHETGCYCQLLGFIEPEPNQVIIMGILAETLIARYSIPYLNTATVSL